MTYKKSFSFVDADGIRARIDAEITERNGYPEFTASGSYTGSSGQCLDHIKPRTHEQKLFIDLWKEYHLKNISELPNNVQFWPDFRGHLDGIIAEIEKQEKEREAKQEEKTGDEKILEMMSEEDIGEGDIDACRAYLDAGLGADLRDFQESYRGQFRSDEDFAMNEAEECDLIDDDAEWPNNCIDWEKAARELMMDYTEQDGFYFRNL